MTRANRRISVLFACAVAAASAARPARMPNAQMQAVLDELMQLGPKPLYTLSAPEARQQPTPADAVKQVLRKQGRSTAPDAAVIAVDYTIPGPGGALPLRIFTPAGASGPLPVVVYYHGGGWVIANKDVYDAGARSISKLANAVVVSVDYRQGPENKFPAAHVDAIVTYRWALDNAASIQGDPANVALAGESAGGKSRGRNSDCGARPGHAHAEGDSCGVPHRRSRHHDFVVRGERDGQALGPASDELVLRQLFAFAAGTIGSSHQPGGRESLGVAADDDHQCRDRSAAVGRRNALAEDA